METEIWKDIEGYEGYYQVSNLGRVKSLSRKRNNGTFFYIQKEKFLKPRDNGNGYLYVDLTKERQTKRLYIHRLVAKAFLDGFDDIKEVNHINENKQDNRLCNIELCNHKYNANYGTKIERTKQTKIINHSDEKMIAEKNRKGSYGAEKPVVAEKDGVIYKFKSLSYASRQLGINISHIHSCCNGKRNYAGGYKWYYDNNKLTTDNGN